MKKFFEFSKVKCEFASTPVGVRAGFFASIPVLLCVFFVVVFIVSRDSEMNIMVRYLMLTNATISLVGACIAQLQYGKFVNDYIDSHK